MDAVFVKGGNRKRGDTGSKALELGLTVPSDPEEKIRASKEKSYLTIGKDGKKPNRGGFSLTALSGGGN